MQFGLSLNLSLCFSELTTLEIVREYKYINEVYLYGLVGDDEDGYRHKYTQNLSHIHSLSSLYK